MDRRINKTKQALKETLTELLEKKEIRKITVKELTEKANINRGTFYLHYTDIYDMIDKLEDDIINDLIAIIESNNPFKLDNYFIPILLKAVEYLKEDMRFCRALIGPNGDINFIEKLKKTIVEQTFKTYKTLSKTQDKTFLHYLTIFIVSGGIGAFQEWINGYCEVPLQLVIQPCELMISSGLKKLS